MVEKDNQYDCFQYDTLNDPTTQIRVLRIISSASTHVECALETRPRVHHRLQYTAVSYTWGPEEDPQHEILVNGKRASVGHNLWLFFQALQNISGFDFKTSLWVDQICINQHEVAGMASEKSAQVAAMGLTFSMAEKVLAWLGPSDDTHSVATSYIRRAGASSAVVEVNECEYSALGILFNQPYWTRLWIVQELYNAKSVQFVYGADIFTRDHLRNLFYFEKEDTTTLATRGNGLETPDIIKTLVASDRSTQPPQNNLIELMVQYKSLLCKERHDRTYALLGLTTCQISVKYEDPVEHLLLELLYHTATSLDQSTQRQLSLINVSMTITEILGIDLGYDEHGVAVALALKTASPTQLLKGSGSRNIELAKLCFTALENSK